MNCLLPTYITQKFLPVVYPSSNVYFACLCAQRSLETIRYAPCVAVVPLLLFFIMTSLGIWAVVLSANAVNTGILRNAIAVAESTVMSLELSLYVTLQPALVTSSFIRQFPQWADLAPRFGNFAQEIYQQSLSEVGLCVTNFKAYHLCMYLGAFELPTYARLENLKSCHHVSFF